MYVRGKRLQKGSTHSSSALQQRRTDGRRHTRETTDTGACDYTARSWKGRRNEKGGKFSLTDSTSWTKKQVKKIIDTMVQITSYNSTITSIYLSRYVYSSSIIFVFLRLCSSHQLLYTLTLRRHSNNHNSNNNDNKVGRVFCDQFIHNHAKIYTWSSDMTH